jgi:hypothetical protein
MQNIDCTALPSLLVSGRASELDYLSAAEQTAALDREAFLLTCDPAELADAADFIALAIAGRHLV